MSARIGLCMIVRNESHVLERALASVRDHVHAATIVDTGSTAKELQAMRQILARTLPAELPWTLAQREWRGFGPARTEALRVAEEWCSSIDYHLILDADDVLEFPVPLPVPDPGGCSGVGLWPDLHSRYLVAEDPIYATWTEGGKDCYTLPVHDCLTTYQRIHLLRADGRWRYEGPVHEFPVREGGGETKGALSWPRYKRIGGGASSKVGTREKYLAYAELLREELARDPEGPNASRWQFYLAWSLSDAGEYERAASAYYKRGHDQAGWSEERYVAWLRRARLRPWVGHIVPELDLREAIAVNPLRAEAPLELAKRYAQEPRMRLDALAWAGYAASLQGPPPDALFSEPQAYAEARELLARLRA